MPNQLITQDSITVHGRGSLSFDYRVNNAAGEQVDISAWTVVFEVDGVSLSVPLVANPADSKGLLLELTNAQVVTLKKSATEFVIRDVRNPTKPKVLWSGKINRVGYVGEPDAVEDA